MKVTIQPRKIVYLMRGLPSCGKSFTAKRLAGKKGAVLETDLYFFTEVGNDNTKYKYNKKLLGKAREWVFDNLKEAIKSEVSPIVIDRGNGTGKYTRKLAKYIVANGYKIQFKEPTSAHWHEIRVLLKYREITKPILYKWADKLAEINRGTHKVSAAKIRRRMNNWEGDITIQDILDDNNL